MDQIDVDMIVDVCTGPMYVKPPAFMNREKMTFWIRLNILNCL